MKEVKTILLHILLPIVLCLAPFSLALSDATLTKIDPYEEFILGDQFLNYGQEYIDGNEASFILYYESVQYEPMLIVSNGAFESEAIDYYVYSIGTDNLIHYMCTLYGPIHSLYYFPSQNTYTGFFCSKVNNDDYETVYLTYDGNTVKTERVSSLYLIDYNGQDDRVTEDSQLYELSINANGRREIELRNKSFVVNETISGWSDLRSISPGFNEEIKNLYLTTTISETMESSTPEPPSLTTPENTATTIIAREPELTTEPQKVVTQASETIETSSIEMPEETTNPVVEPQIINSNYNYPRIGTTKIKKVNVRNKPSASGKRITYVVDPETKVTIIGEEKNANDELWYRVQLDDGQEGYILSTMIQFETDSANNDYGINAGVETPTFPYLAKTNNKKVNLREKADSNSRRVTYINEKGTIVTVLDEVKDKDGNSWYKVSLDNNTGYVKSNLLDYFSSNASYRQSYLEDTIDDFNTVTVYIKIGRKEAAFSGPGTNYIRGANGKAYTNTTNDEIYVYGEDSGWVLIRYNVKTKPAQWRFAYVRRETFSNESEIPILSFERKKATVKKRCIVTDDPLYSKNEIAKLQKSEKVLYLAKLGQWAYIEANSTRGFVKLDYLNLSDGVN